jgi:hypothetical protein
LYPELDFDVCWDYFSKIQSDIQFSHNDMEDSDFDQQEPEVDDDDSDGDAKLNRAQFEIAFIRAKRYDKERGIKGALCRSEFLDLLVRMLSARYPKDSKFSTVVGDFVNDYFI